MKQQRELDLIDLPDWIDDLVDKIKAINTDAITEPITGLYTGLEIEGWTIPPFMCFICGAEFTGSDAEKNYAGHLMSHLKAFQESWF